MEKAIAFIEKRFGKNFVLILGLAGIGLILLSEFLPARSETKTAKSSAPPAVAAQEDYAEALERRLEALLSQMEGAGKTTVMVTLVSQEQTVYALDTQSAGEAHTTQSHILLADGTALYETILTPEISGVAVVCEGGDNIVLNARMTELLSALLGLPTSHISIQKMKGNTA